MASARALSGSFKISCICRFRSTGRAHRFADSMSEASHEDRRAIGHLCCALAWVDKPTEGFLI